MKLIILLFYLALHCLTYAKNNDQFNPFEQAVYKASKELAQVISTVQKNHVLSENDLPIKSLNILPKFFVKEFDPHSVYMDEKMYRETMQSVQGELCGIGIIVDHTKDEDDEFLRIVDTLPSGPADKAGLKAQDKIIAVDNMPVKGMPLEEVISKLKGKPKTSVNAKVQRNEEEKIFDVDIEREIVKEPNALCFHFHENESYYLCLNMFTQNSVKQVEDILKKIQHQKSKAFILDVRNNSGGLLTAVIDILGLLLGKERLVVSTKGRDDQTQEKYFTQKNNIPLTAQMPIFVLVNNYTASAAEILAGCLQHYTHELTDFPPVFIVGLETFGKGSVQEIIPLGNDTALKLTTRLYLLPNQALIQGKGIIPDFKIVPKIPLSKETNWFNDVFGREAALKNSLELDTHTKKLRQQPEKKVKQSEKKEPQKSWYEKKRELIASDYTILNTLRLIELYHLLLQAEPQLKNMREEIIQRINKLFVLKDQAAVKQIEV